MSCSVFKIALTTLFFLSTDAYDEYGHNQRQFASREELHDTEHIKHHLDGEVNIDPENLDDERTQFHYFRMYDSNKDMRIDGVELIHALTHWEDHAKEQGYNQSDFEPTNLSESDLEYTVDLVLREGDLNQDGFIDWPEFISYVKKEDEKAKMEEQKQKAGKPSATKS